MKAFQTLAKVCAFGVVALTAGTASAWQYYPGSAFKASFAGDVSCLNVQSYSAIRNDCATARLVTATVPMWTVGWHPTSVYLYGNNTWCETTTVNGVGNGSNLGATTYTLAGPMQWQSLNTGDRYVWEDTALVFRCNLQPGGVIGGFSID